MTLVPLPGVQSWATGLQGLFWGSGGEWAPGGCFAGVSGVHDRCEGSDLWVVKNRTKRPV